MQEHPIQTLEVRAHEQDRSVTITAAVTADASAAIFVALSEQLDRHRRAPTESVQGVLVLREQQSLAMRERLQVIAQITPVLWDANASAAAAGEPLTRSAQCPIFQKITSRPP